MQDLKRFLQFIGFSVSSKSKTDSGLFLYDSARNHSWLSSSLARRLNLSGKKTDLILNKFDSTDIISTGLVEVTLSADIKNMVIYTFNVTAYFNYEMKVGSQKVDAPDLQEKVSLPGINKTSLVLGP